MGLFKYTPLLTLLPLCLFHCASALWPVPRSLQTGSTLLKLSSNFTIQLDLPQAPQDLHDAIGRTQWRLYTDRLHRLIVGRGANDSDALAHAPSLAQLTLALTPESPPIQSIMEEATKDIATRNEMYSLFVPDTDQGVATLNASSSLGLLRGLTTFEQLWYEVSDTVYSYQAPVQIYNDTPAFPYRGFMLDTARNFFPVSDIKRTLDAMSMVKMSQFHWHIVDSQSFPLNVTEFPELSAKGAYSAQEVYSPEDVQNIVTYAGVRGIDVLMEIDTPGHTASISASHPEHIACAQAVPWQTFANEPPAGQLRFTSPATANFTVSLLSSIAKTLPSTLFSTGGDEVNEACYNQDSETQSDLKHSGKDLFQSLNVFMQTVQNALKSIGKVPVVWEEMALEYDQNVTLSNETVVMVWVSSQHAAAVVAKGLRIVHSASDYFYLDCGAGQWLGNLPTQNSWCDPFKSWQKAYTFDPLADLSQSHIPLVLGGQQLLWTEQSGPENLDSIVWPRAAVSSEIFWTGATLPDGTPRNVLSALPRLHDLRYRMVQRGVKAIPLQPQWCAMRDGSCNY